MRARFAFVAGVAALALLTPIGLARGAENPGKACENPVPAEKNPNCPGADPKRGERSASATADPKKDSDRDGVPDRRDNCPTAWNHLQEDEDGDRHGDTCDPTTDLDGDAIPEHEDNCPGLEPGDSTNHDQKDTDDDGTGDACESESSPLI